MPPSRERVIRFASLAAAALAVSLLAGAEGAKDSFKIAGSGTNIPITKRLLDAYRPKTGLSIELPPSIGTAGAIKALLAGALDVGLTSRSLKTDERASGLVELPYARIGIVLGVNPSVPDRSIDGPALAAIFAGTKASWSNGRMIVVLSRERGDSSNAALSRLVPGFKGALEGSLAAKRWDIFYTDADAAEAIKSTRDSIGITDTSYLAEAGKEIRALRFEGVEPSTIELRSGRYRLSKDLYFVFREPLPAPARAFIDFALSNAATGILEGGGAIRPAPIE